MFSVNVDKYDFVTMISSGSKVDIGTNTETWNISYAAVVRAALLVGRRSMHDVFYFGEHSRHELRWRSAMIRANTMLRNVGDDPVTAVMRLVPSPAFSALDGSEKTAVSYMVGIATGKIMAERECDVRWLMHLDVYSRKRMKYPGARLLVEDIPEVKGRPDLVGQSLGGQWAVVEAKGRSSKSDFSLRLKAKRQTQKIKFINGQEPNWRLASVGQLLHDGFQIDIVDPIGPSDDAFDINISPDLFMFLAYRVIFEILWFSDRQTITVSGQEFVTVDLPEVDLTIGLKKAVFDALSRPLLQQEAQIGLEFTGSISEIIKQAVENIPSNGHQESGEGFEEYSVGPDGTFVGLGKSWKHDPETDVDPPLLPLSTAYADFVVVERVDEPQVIKVENILHDVRSTKDPISEYRHMWYGNLEEHVDAPRIRLILDGSD